MCILYFSLYKMEYNRIFCLVLRKFGHLFRSHVTTLLIKLEDAKKLSCEQNAFDMNLYVVKKCKLDTRD